MLDLAPHHKIGLSVKNPILLAGGTIGYGEALHPGLDVKQLGAVVVGPLLRHSAAGAPPPRLAEVAGGFILATGLQNRGVSDVIKRFARLWTRLGTPVIVQVAETYPQSLAFVLEQLATIESVVAIELLFAPDTEAEIMRRAVHTAGQVIDLPLWVKLPLASAALMAPVAVAAGAVGVVVGQPPLGAAMRTMAGESAATMVQGTLHGPLVFSLMLAELIAVSKLALPAALIACGGIHTQEQAQTALNIPGVGALQLDGALWVEPGLPMRLAAAFSQA